MVPSSFVLPKIGDLSGDQLGFLDRNFVNLGDLIADGSILLSRLNSECSDLDGRLLHLRRNLTQRTVSWISSSFAAKFSIQSLRMRLESLSLRTSLSGSWPKAVQRQLNQELSQLVEELCRIQNIRKYFETALKLEAQVGDLEDSVFHPTNNQQGSMLHAKLFIPPVSMDFALKQERFNQAIKAMNNIEEILIDVTRYHSLWSRLVESVDSRVDKSLSILRPQIIAEHRALLASLDWPPKLAASKRENEEVSSIPNPLLLMQGDKKESYSQSFLALCALQHTQTRRDKRKKSRNMPKHGDVALWAIDELVLPIASRMEYHFMKWVEQPEFIFALVYKVTRHFGDGVDGVLQPLIDKARLVSCSAKEAWVSAMIQMLSGFLAKRVFPALAEGYKEKHMKSEVISSWLHLVDLMVAFDKRMQSLVSIDSCFFQEDSFASSRGDLSVMVIFCDKPEWLKTFEKIELKDAYRKLKEEIKEEKPWLVDNEKTKAGLESNAQSANFALSSREDYKAPFAAEYALNTTWKLIERGLTLPAIPQRIHFVRATASKFLWYVIKILLLQYKKAEFSYDDQDEAALIEVCGIINAARYIESKLQEWSDDLNIVEMTVAEEAGAKVHPKPELPNQSRCFFEEEVRSLIDLETNWLMEIITVLLHQFENLSRDYFHSNKLLAEENLITDSSDMAVSQIFAEALDGLRRQLHILKQNLNQKDFLDLWRSLAEGLDHYIFQRIFSGEIFFPRIWIDQLGGNMRALLVVFRPYCVRPDAFYPRVKETLRLLRMSEEEVKRLRIGLLKDNGKSCMTEFGISHLPVQQVERFLRCCRPMSCV